MSVAIKNISETGEKSQVSSRFTDQQIHMIKEMIAKDLTDIEFQMFIYICIRHNLDPLARQIYAVKRWDKRLNKHVMTIQTSIDGFRLIAERTGKYAPGSATQFLYDDNGKLLGATAYVKKLTQDGTWHNISATALMSEYNAGKNLWLSMPHVMIEKCAEARSLRRAFPADLSALYSEDEMDQIDKSDEFTDGPIDTQQVEDLIALLFDREDLLKRMLSFCEVKSIKEIKKSQFNTCLTTIQKLIAKEKAEELNT